MGLLAGLISKATGSVKQLINNAQIGKAATASGFVQGVLTPGQQAQQSWNPLHIIGGVVAIVLTIIAIFSFSSKR